MKNYNLIPTTPRGRLGLGGMLLGATLLFAGCVPGGKSKGATETTALPPLATAAAAPTETAAPAPAAHVPATGELVFTLKPMPHDVHTRHSGKVIHCANVAIVTVRARDTATELFNAVQNDPRSGSDAGIGVPTSGFSLGYADMALGHLAPFTGEFTYNDNPGSTAGVSATCKNG